MSVMQIEATTATPAVNWQPEAGVLELTGESYPENAIEFYTPILTAVAEYLQQGEKPALRLELNLSYLNTSSVKAMMDLLDLVEEAHGQGAMVQVNWYHDPDDDRAQEVAEEFCEDLTLPFSIKTLPSQGPRR